jgi:hypothetical protein
VREAAVTVCSVDDCDKPAKMKGWCYMHYSRWYRHGDVNLTNRLPMEQRFWAKVNKTDGGCWEWTAVTNQHGYGHLHPPGSRTPIYAHRYSAMLHFGMFDRRLFVLHHCDNPPCVNPDHLYLGDHKDNARDMVQRGRHWTPWVTQAHCKRGHEFTPENTYTYMRDGKPERACRRCNKAAQTARRQRKAAQS